MVFVFQDVTEQNGPSMYRGNTPSRSGCARGDGLSGRGRPPGRRQIIDGDESIKGRVPPACGYIQEACLVTVKRTKRPRQGGPHGILMALSFLMTPSTPDVWTHGVCSGHLTVPLPTTLRAHTPTG